MAIAVAVDTWGATGVRVGDVVNALSELRHQVDERGSARTAVMTVIAVAPGDEQAYAATKALRSLGGHHPARLLILRPDPDQAAALDARATLYAVDGGDHHTNFEEITLAVRGQAANHLDSLVEAFTLSDLPVAVWYVSSIPDPADPLLQVATAVLLDSRDVAGAGQLRPLLELARRRTVVDLSWRRLRPWRDLLAGLFDPAPCRTWLEAVDKVEVQGKTLPRQLLGGWLTAQLRLQPGQVALAESRHVEVRVTCRRGPDTATFAVQRGEQQRTLTARASLPSGEVYRQSMPLADDALQIALNGALASLQPDPIWERALSAVTSITA